MYVHMYIPNSLSDIATDLVAIKLFSLILSLQNIYRVCVAFFKSTKMKI